MIGQQGPFFPGNFRGFLQSLRRGPLTEFDDLKNPYPAF